MPPKVADTTDETKTDTTNETKTETKIETTVNLDGRALDVTITSTTFAKVANYFVALQVNKGKKVRTEVSAGTEKPKFKKSQHILDLGEDLHSGTKASLTLGAFVVLPSKNGGKGNARLLGSVTYEVGEAAVRLLRGQTVPEDLSLVRKTGEREVVVGKISVAISLVGVGDAVDARNVDPATRVVDIIVHGKLAYTPPSPPSPAHNFLYSNF